MNIQKMMKQAQEIQSKLADAQKQMAEKEIDGVAGAGLVKVVIVGKGEARKVIIDPSLMAPEEKEVLEDLLVAAFNDARNKADTELNDKIGALTSGLGLPPGFKLPV